ncbi:ABC transporter permease [Candidatus Woesebacteria bacterium]|nr:ABC transporter permease [Candidatus Woesebacteria bacterium]
MHEVNAILTIAYRDFSKFLRDRGRIIATFIFPFVFVGILGSSLQSNLGANAGYNFLTFIFIGVLGQTLFQSTASGVISLIEDRENDFSQEIFVSPISRYSIIVGKILGESLVALTQGIGVFLFGFVMGVHLTVFEFLRLAPFALIVCALGGAFGVFVLSNLKSQRAANQIFPFVIFPQFFLAGVFGPVKNLPPALLVLSRIAPMTYAVDLVRSVFYTGMAEYSKTVLFSTLIDLVVIGAMFLLFISIGTIAFVSNERNR